MARIPAHEIEQVIIDTLRMKMVEILALDETDDHAVIKYITDTSLPLEKFVRETINRIIVVQDELQIEVNTVNLHCDLEKALDLKIPLKFETSAHIINIPFTTRKSYKGAIRIEPENRTKDFLDLPPQQLKNLVRGIVWRDEHFAGMSLSAIADRDGFSKQHVQQLVMKSMAINL